MSRDRNRPWKRAASTTQVGVPRAPRGPNDEDDDDSQPIPVLVEGGDTSKVVELQTSDFERLPEVGGETQLVLGLQARSSVAVAPPTPPAGDPTTALRRCLAVVRADPGDRDARARLRSVAIDAATREQLAALLAEEARTTRRPEVAAACFEELADVLEDLERPVEAIGAMESLVRLAPDELLHHDRLARLYHRASAWVKAAESFEQVAALARGDARARAALRAAARLYRDNGRPERAIEMYRVIAERHPTDLEAWRGLDELLEASGRWAELAEVRGALAARSLDGVDKAALLRSQARALEQADDRATAAVVVAEAARLVPEQVSGLVDYADVLARSGRGREGAELLARRVAEAEARGARDANLAALRLRHAAILEDACGDRPASAAVLEALLADAPAHLPALERLVWQASHDPDPRVHAAALLRQAAALPEPADRVAAMIEAARKLRDAGDLAASARVFDEAAELEPDDVDLALERDRARAALLIQRAAADARTGDTASAERRLRAVLATRPHDPDANLAVAQLLEDTGRAEDAAEHLAALLEVHPDPFARAARARLVHRYALVVAALGAADEGHQLLHEAHALDRRSLVITLALGESCFARKLWRESAIHLGSLADHPDARAHAAAVAAGLVHAAHADTRALRPGNAEGRFTAAVKLDPGCAAAWHGLAELATARGDLRAAAGHLEREAAASPEPRDRARLFEAVGELALGPVGDPAQAERCWIAAVAAVDGTKDAGAKIDALLGKLLAVQRKRGAGRERGQTCERLAERTPAARKALLEEAAEAYAAGGDHARAAAIAHELVAAHPLDGDAVACAVAVAVAAGELAPVADWLGRALAAWDGDTTGKGALDPRRAELWRRLGDARRARGDAAGARLAYERSVVLAPESDGAHAARRGLVALATADGRSATESLAGLVAAEQDPDDVLAWARACAADGHDDARPLFELAEALGVARSPADDRFLAEHPARVLAPDQGYAAPLDEAERRALVDDDADGPLAATLALLADVATLVCPTAAVALFDSELADAERLTASSALAAAAIYPQIGKALGGPTTLLYATPSRHAADVTLLLAAPPAVILGPQLAAQPAAEVRFRLGRAVELARLHRAFAAGVAPERFVHFVEGLRWAVLHPEEDAPDPAVAREAKRLRAAIPLLVRRRVAERFAGTAPADAAAYLAACERAADRSGLLACGDAATAIRLAGGPRTARHLVRLAGSPRYLAARRALFRPLPNRR